MFLVHFRTRFLTEFADSVNFLSQGSCSRGLVAASYSGNPTVTKGMRQNHSNCSKCRVPGPDRPGWRHEAPALKL